MKKRIASLVVMLTLVMLPLTAVWGDWNVPPAATLDELKEGEYAPRPYGKIITNNGTVGINYGTIKTNNGTIETNYGTINNIGQSGIVQYNKGTVTGTNSGKILNNYEKLTNNGTVEINWYSGQVNGGTVTEMRGGTANYCTITSMYGGTASGSTIENYYGGSFDGRTTVTNLYYEVSVSAPDPYGINVDYGEQSVVLDEKRYIKSNGKITLTTKSGNKFSGVPSAPGATVTEIVKDEKYEITGFSKKTNITANYSFVISIPTLFRVTFDANGGQPVPAPQSFSSTNAVVAVPEEPTKEGYDFLGWFYNNEVFYFNERISEAIELKAKWAKSAYEVTFDAGEGTLAAGMEDLKAVTCGDSIAKPADPTRMGFAFSGWAINDEPVSFPYTPRSHVTLKAQWERNNVFDVSGIIKQGEKTTWVLAVYDDKTLIESEVVPGSAKQLSASAENQNKDARLFLLDENYNIILEKSTVISTQIIIVP